VASFRHTVTVPRPPDQVFPWLLEEDKVPQWTSRLEAYDVVGDGSIGRGTRIRQVLIVKGQKLDVDMEVTAYDPPRAAESRLSLRGVDIDTVYSLTPVGEGTELTQSLDGKATSFKARMLLPVVQPHLEGKIADDLERLRELLSAG
jgi:uncharacterized protein YndB with AHSA1/START domain